MHSKKVLSKGDVGKSKKRYHRNVGPNVTINNIVTLDPEKYGKSPSTSKSQDSDYDRVKFLVEERARYWRDLKVLYNDYTLVKLKQKELLGSEDNYVNQHCIDETVKLSNALKSKIQAKCKDIIFITNLCGNTDVNRVVQSLADGEDIDRVLTKKQKKVNETNEAEAEKKRKLKSKKSKVKETLVKHVDPVEEKETDKSAPSVPPKRKPAINEPKFFDSELHWCQYCNVFPPTIKKYLQHLHDESHKKKIKELKINESPWHKCLPEEQSWRTESTDSVCVKAFNFFVPANGWFCQLCRSWMGDIHCAATHLRSYVHNMNLKNFQEKFPQWKQGWLDERAKALEKTFEGRKESVDNIQQQQSTATISRKKNEPESSSDDENPTEPISRHRTSKAEMWVPNQKAFERVRKETNPIVIDSQSSLAKIKVTKKDRPPFIGKMPLINRNKKIVVKELPQNTTEKIATSCAESDKLQKQQDELTEMIIRRNEEENELKLKEFMRLAKKIKKGKKKMLDSAMIAECYNATEFVPVVETVDPIENLIGPPALVSQWEADANYEYYMRQVHHYNMASQMMQMSQPQTFLLDPYHAIALHNQQYYNNNHMISNQYENFEIISREEEQAYSQYIEFQNSPSSSPTRKMFVSGQGQSNTKSHMQTDTTRGERKSRSLGENSSDKMSGKRSSTQEDTRGSRSKRPLNTSANYNYSNYPKKLKTAHVIQKPPCLNTTSNSALMPSFKETFLSAENSSSYIASLLSSNEEVKIVCANEPYKKRTVPSKRRREKKKKARVNQKNSEREEERVNQKNSEREEERVNQKNSEREEERVNQKNSEKEVKSTEPTEVHSELKNNTKITETAVPSSLEESEKKCIKSNDDKSIDPISTSNEPNVTPKKNLLKDKINSIRKAIDLNKLLDSGEEDSITKTKIVKDTEAVEDEVADVPATFGDTEKLDSRTSSNNDFSVDLPEIGNKAPGVQYERYGKLDESEDSEDDGDLDKLIYYDMTSI